MEAVIKPFSCVNSSGRMMNLRTDSARDTPHWLIDPLLDFGADGRVAGGLLHRHISVETLAFQPWTQRFLVKRDQRGDERTLVAKHQRLRDEFATLDDILDRAEGRRLAAGVMMRSFLRPMMYRKPSSSMRPKSPVLYQPSSVKESSVASPFLWYFGNTEAPLT